MNSLTVSLELGKKMKELGWEKKTYFNEMETVVAESFDGDGVERYGYVSILMPTAQEILDELPKKVKGINPLTQKVDDDYDSILEIMYCEDYPYAGYVWAEKFEIVESNLAEALGQLRCWVKESCFIEDSSDA